VSCGGRLASSNIKSMWPLRRHSATLYGLVRAWPTLLPLACWPSVC
jgi:hypothetical protein